MDKKRLVCAITMGDPGGIGPEVLLKAMAEEKIQKLANFLVIGSSAIFEQTANLLKMKLAFTTISSEREFVGLKRSSLTLFDIDEHKTKLEYGLASKANGLLALNCIQTALRLIKSLGINVLTTAPVNKHTISQSGRLFRGHTEYLAQATKTKNFAMMLVGGRLKVALVTRHIALKDVATVLSQQKIYQTIVLVAQALRQDFGISHPRIGVCGLNPHSSDSGTLGHEEKKIIQPAVNQARRLACVSGPLSADTLFYSALHGSFDAVVAMYHDQGLIPLKMLALHQGVNLTLGLPFIRTSPDHGSAYDIAGKNKANPGSMIEAIKLAVQIGVNRCSPFVAPRLPQGKE